jgi:hypothetical protein
MDLRAPRASRAAASTLFLILVAVLAVIAGCGDDRPLAPGTPEELNPDAGENPGVPANPDDPADPGTSPDSLVETGVGRPHKMLIYLGMSDFEHPGLSDLTRGFDAFLYGHFGAYEDQVQALESRGLESFRYFNVMTTDPLYPSWPGFYAELHEYLRARNGWIPGVGYRFFSDPRNPDRIIDHTRPEITAGVKEIINRWSSRVGADNVFLDLTFDRLEDWMIRDGDRWPWPASQHALMNQRWRSNMQALAQEAGAPRDAMINGSPFLAADMVLFESQVWNDRRGWVSWSEVMRRIITRETIPALHVGHHHLSVPDAWLGESIVLAAWLIADESYLLVEPHGRPLYWARAIRANGYNRFVSTTPIIELERGRYARYGTIDGRRWRVEVDVNRKRGLIAPAP